MEGGSAAVLQGLGRIGRMLFEEFDLIQTYSHLIVAALFPIYIGSHASLRCPPEVAAEKREITQNENDDDDDDDLEVEPIIEGLSPSDAILFPILAGCMLAALYFLINWLRDAALLNKVLGWYFSSIGVLGVGRLAADGLNVATTFAFPSVWTAGGKTYKVDARLQKALVEPDMTQNPADSSAAGVVGATFTPLPGPFSKMGGSSSSLWNIRALFADKWILRLYLHGLANVKSKIRLNDVIGFFIGATAIFAYNVYGKAWWLTNVMAFGFSYGTLQLLSPTTFWTGSLVLGGLFIYDIVMVFYTPLMVTVATSLDIPIKLVFPGAKRGSMLGLGDVVLPGIMMALALRFDLYMHYLRKKRTLQAVSATNPKGSNKLPTYYPATGFYGERFWTAPSWFPFSKANSSRQSNIPEAYNGGKFSKPYFYASIAGYTLSMLVTLVVMNVYKHAQPALLYLVPGVLGSLWGTGLVRGELKEMWAYTEVGALEEVDGSKAVEGQSASATEDGKLASASVSQGEQEGQKKKKPKTEERAHHVVLLSLSRPRHRVEQGQLSDKEKKSE